MPAEVDSLRERIVNGLTAGLEDFPVAAVSVQAGLSAEFVEAGVYEAVKAVDARAFDVVYTSIGAIIWLPDVTRRASTVVELLHEHPYALRARWPFLERRPDRTTPEDVADAILASVNDETGQLRWVVRCRPGGADAYEA